jgi:hypothetical protein
VESKPVADVYVDGKKVGKTPYEVKLEPGTDQVELELRAPGHVKKPHKVTRSDEEKVTVDLQRIPSAPRGTPKSAPELAPR